MICAQAGVPGEAGRRNQIHAWHVLFGDESPHRGVRAEVFLLMSRRFRLAFKLFLGLGLVALLVAGGIYVVVLADLPGPGACLLYTSPSPRDRTRSRMPSSA